MAEEGWGLTKRLREAERAAKAFAQVVRVRVRVRVRIGLGLGFRVRVRVRVRHCQGLRTGDDANPSLDPLLLLNPLLQLALTLNPNPEP